LVGVVLAVLFAVVLATEPPNIERQRVVVVVSVGLLVAADLAWLAFEATVADRVLDDPARSPLLGRKLWVADAALAQVGWALVEDLALLRRALTSPPFAVTYAVLAF
jgi:hypothetical protein